MNKEERHDLRDSLRETRRGLTDDQQISAAESLRSLVAEQDFYHKATRIAFYNGVDGEIDPKPLMEQALSEGKACFLPTITEDNPDLVSFAPFDSDTPLSANRWGIGEPPHEDATVSPTDFDVVFVPLVGFDAHCFRLGMGKGFYDRTFSFKIFNRRSRPMLIGLAHECQLTDSFPTASWDVRLDAVITSEKIYRPDTA